MNFRTYPYYVSPVGRNKTPQEVAEEKHKLQAHLQQLANANEEAEKKRQADFREAFGKASQPVGLVGNEAKSAKAFRILRILEYTGTREWLDMCMAKRSVKESYNCGNGTIREAMMGGPAEQLARPQLDFSALLDLALKLKDRHQPGGHSGCYALCQDLIEEIDRLSSEQESL